MKPSLTGRSPGSLIGIYGTTEVMPFQSNLNLNLFVRAAAQWSLALLSAEA